MDELNVLDKIKIGLASDEKIREWYSVYLWNYFKNVEKND